jgi:hypothetical protein
LYGTESNGQRFENGVTMTDPNVYWGTGKGGTQIPIVNVVAAFGVDNTGGSDAAALLRLAFASLALSGQIPWLPSGTYLVNSDAPPAAGQTVWTGGNVTFTGSHAASVANVTFSVSAAPETPAYCPAWYALTDIYWDPQAGSDISSGQVGAPVATFAEIVRRFGGSSPMFNYGQNLIIHKLSAQSAGVDPFFFEPNLSGGGKCVLADTLTVAQAAFVGGVVTPKTVGAPGNLLQVASMPGGTTQYQLVYNQTRNSYAFIDSMVGATATMQQPIPAAAITVPGTAPTEDNTWATGDTLVIYNTSALNYGRFVAKGGDWSAGGSACSTWIQFSRIVDSSGAGNSKFLYDNKSATNTLAACRVDSTFFAQGEGSSGGGAPALVGCALTGSAAYFGGSAVTVFGGGFANGFTSTCTGLGLGGDTIVHGNVNNAAYAGYANVYSDASWIVQSATIQVLGTIWGSMPIELIQGGKIAVQSGTFAAGVKTSGALKLDAFTTGSYFSSGSGLWVDGISLTAANIDTYGGLCDPQNGNSYSVPGGGGGTNLVRVTFAGGGGSVATPYTAKPGDTVVVDSSGGAITVNIPTLGVNQFVQVNHDPNTSIATNTVSVVGIGANIEEPVPNNGTFVGTFAFGGSTSVYSGSGIVGASFRWFNGGSAGGYQLAFATFAGTGSTPAPFVITPSATVTTTDATVTTIYTEPAEAASTTYDYIGTIVGQKATTGDIYRADFAFNEQRIGAAAPTAAGAVPVPLNVRTAGLGNTWGGITFTVAGNSVVFQVQGLAATTIVWNLQLSRTSVP